MLSVEEIRQAKEILRQAAHLIAAGQSVEVEDGLYHRFVDCMAHPSSSGFGSRKQWIAALKATSEFLEMVAKRNINHERVFSHKEVK